MDYLSELEYLSSIEQKRSLRAITDRQGKYVTINDKQFLDFSSNDYLGIAGDKSLREEFLQEVDLANYSFSSSASRLMSGNFLLNEQLESIISKLYRGKEVLVFGSGFQANTGIIPALIRKKDVIFADKQVHASIIDGILLSGAKLYRYKHNDMTSLRELLEKHRGGFDKAWIITESIFSMDGDTADLKKIIEYKETYNLSVFVDEAHAFGVRGSQGEGVCVELGLSENVDIIVGTFGKALASVGAFVACDKTTKEYLVNKARSFIFSTALPPINILWTKWLLEKVVPCQVEQRLHLLSLSAYFRDELKRLGYTVMGDSQIVPIIMGDNKTTLELARKLEEVGVLAFAVRPPTVAKGSSRIRFSLNAGIYEADLSEILEVLAENSPTGDK